MSAVNLALFLLGAIAANAERELPILAALGPGGAPFLECKFHMRGHEAAGNQIRICFSGNGNYDLDALKHIWRRDWFPLTEGMLLAGQVEEVRVTCSLAGNASLSEVLFPSKDEAMRGRKIRIEVPCTGYANRVVSNMQRARQLIRDAIETPGKVMESTRQTLAACEKSPGSKTCKRWKAFIGDIISGKAVRRTTGPLQYCSMNFNVQLEGEAQRPWASHDPLDDLDLESPVGGFYSPRQREITEWVLSRKPSCAFEKFSQEKCLPETMELRKLLENRGVVFGADGTASVGGSKVTQWTKDTEDPLALVVANTLQSEEYNASLIATKRTGGDYTKATGSREEWEKALDLSGFRGVDGIRIYEADNGGVDYNSYPERIGAGCGLDIACQERKLAAWLAFTSQAKDSLPKGACHKVSDASIGEGGAIRYEFVPHPGGCRN